MSAFDPACVKTQKLANQLERDTHTHKKCLYRTQDLYDALVNENHFLMNFASRTFSHSQDPKQSSDARL
jgi:hypothetical protein